MCPDDAGRGPEWRMPSAREQAEAAVALADRELSAALPALRAAVTALAGADPGSRSLARRALGHALLHGGRADEAVTELRAAVRLAQRSGEPGLAAPARTKLAFALHLTGRLTAALRQADLAAAESPDDVERARALGTRALIHRERGHAERALADLDAAVGTLRRAGDELGLQRVLINRAILRVDTGACITAEKDLDEAEQLATRLARPAAVALIASNLGYAASRAGDIPRALAEYARAEVAVRANGLQVSGLLMDRAELLHATGLNDEARDDGERAVASARAERRTLRIPETRLLLARVAATAGDHGLALEQARLARGGFRRQGRTTWAAAAGVQLALIAREMGGRRRHRTLAEQATVLAAAGWVAEAVEAWLLVASLAPEPDRADALAAASRHRDRGPALVRAQGWYARAVQLEDDPGAAGRAVRRGLDILDQHVAAVGADDLRAGLARHRLALAGLGVDLALRHRRPTGVLEAVERARATVLVRDTVRPPADPGLAELLSRYRAARDGRARADLARRIQERTRSQRGGGELLRPASMRAVDRRLGDAGLAVWFVRDGRLAAVTRVAGRSRMHPLGAESEARSALDRVLFATRRLAREEPAERPPEGLARLIGDAAQALSAALFGGLDELRDRELVLVPPPFLHATPWHELPGLAARPVTVAASVRQWLRAADASPRGGRIAVAAGPALPGALAEAEAVAALHGVIPRTGAEATVARVLADLSEADLAHLATHGWLRADNPQFSELTLSDGDLMVHHLDTIDRLPSTLILACCDTGRPVTLPGEGMLGFAAACLVRGVRTLIAPVAPVPDGATAGVMIALHERLRSGVPPARALAEAQRDQPPGHRAIVCFGTGSL